MTDEQLLRKAVTEVHRARKKIREFNKLAHSYALSMDRSSHQLRSDIQHGVARRKGILIPLKELEDILFVDNYEMHYTESLIELVDEFLRARSENGRKLALRPIIESIYHYGEASLLPPGSGNSRINRFRHLQVLFFKFYIARVAGGVWIDEYIKYLSYAKKHLPAQKLKLFPSTAKDLNSAAYEDKNILKCIELMVTKVGSLIPEPNWYSVIFGDISLLAHGNPFGVTAFKPRKNQKREECLSLSILLKALSEAARLMTKSEETNQELRNELLKYSNDFDNYFVNQMRHTWAELTRRQL